MVLDQAKDIDVFYKDSTIFVTYVSNKNGKNWQVYMGTYNADTQFPTISGRYDNGDWLMFAGEENYDASTKLCSILIILV
ncbi:hypothetical protein M3Y94_00894200 [Aphelenchoides besseyi]|nr:hypothetical protein M3Y94_00894200 [Aphelenchoides besseyi]